MTAFGYTPAETPGQGLFITNPTERQVELYGEIQERRMVATMETWDRINFQILARFGKSQGISSNAPDEWSAGHYSLLIDFWHNANDSAKQRAEQAGFGS